MLTKPINEFLWKTALAKGCFCFHKSSSYSFQTVFHPSDDRLSQSQMWLRLGRAVIFPYCDWMVPTLETERLVLRAHRLKDFSDLAALWSDPVVARFISGIPQTPE